MEVRSILTAAATLLLASRVCMADTASGTINLIETNYGAAATRVYLTNVSAMCAGAGPAYQGWAYIAPGDGANYSVMVAALFSAKAIGSTVDIWTQLDGNGFCHIYDIVVH